MTVNTTLTGFAGILEEFVRSMPALQHAAMERAAQVVETEARRAIGTDDYGWPPLAASTLERKSADTPLLETGEMRDSIEHVSSKDEATIGSNLDRAVFHELGTNKIPPRSFLAGALQHKAEEVVEIIGHGVVGKLATGSGNMGHGEPAYQSEGKIDLHSAAPSSGQSGNFNP